VAAVTYVRVVRRVTRAPFDCLRCGYPTVEYQPLYQPTIGGVALGDYCSLPCAKSQTAAEVEVFYG
jgi:hypothetical protein